MEKPREYIHLQINLIECTSMEALKLTVKKMAFVPLGPIDVYTLVVSASVWHVTSLLPSDYVFRI